MVKIQWALLLVLSSLLLVSCGTSSTVRTGPLRKESLVALARDSVERLAPRIAGGNQSIYDYYRKNQRSRLKENLRDLDFSGVAMDQKRTATLISPRHVVMARHFARKVGSEVIFHDRSGRPHKRRLIATKSFQRNEQGRLRDITIGLLDREVPVAYYRVLAPRNDYDKYLLDAPVVVTNQRRQVYLHGIHSIGNGIIGFGPAKDLPGVAGKIIVGDSSNPSFLLLNGELILVETHTGGGFGVGPFYSDPDTVKGINTLMRELGGGYQLSYVSLN